MIYGRLEADQPWNTLEGASSPLWKSGKGAAEDEPNELRLFSSARLHRTAGQAVARRSDGPSRFADHGPACAWRWRLVPRSLLGGETGAGAAPDARSHLRLRVVGQGRETRATRAAPAGRRRAEADLFVLFYGRARTPPVSGRLAAGPSPGLAAQVGRMEVPAWLGA